MAMSKINNMYESEIRDILKTYSYLLSDVSGIKYPKGEMTNGFHQRSAYSCDNVVLWMLCHDTGQKGTIGRGGTTTGYAMATVREILRRYMDSPSIKFIGRGRDRDGDPTRDEIHAMRRRHMKMGSGYMSGYIAIKVSLSDVDLAEVHEVLSSAMDDLRASYVVLHDIDIFTDCSGITNRHIIQDYLLANGVTMQSIVNDRMRVGDDCISWMARERRNKIYNKYIQMLQSCDVRKSIGSIIGDLVYNPSSDFTDKLIEYAQVGMSRVETTFYSARLRSIGYYTNKMDDLLEFMEGCPVYYVSLDKQWRRLLRSVTSSFAVYVANKRMFAYSHWWNSITGKSQGYLKHKVDATEVKTLLANYSFNDRPMYYIKGNILLDGTFEISKRRTYHRESGSIMMTLVPGANRSLYPSFARLERSALSFEDVGIISYRNITIDWPMKRLRKTTKPLVKIASKKGIPTEDEIDTPVDEKQEDQSHTLKEVNISMEGRFQSSHALAENGPVTYTIIGYGYRRYYGESTTHLLALDGTRIRCTRGLQSIVEDEIANGVHFQIRLIRAISVNKYRDVLCEIVA